MKLTTLAVTLMFAGHAFASTPVEMVEKIDKDREGNLAQLVTSYFQKTVASTCTEGQVKIQAFKLSSYSSNEEKVPGTPYTYSANYLVTQKCMLGSTFVGAGVDVEKAVLIGASFKGIYKKGTYTPAQMSDVKISVLKDASEVIVSP